MFSELLQKGVQGKFDIFVVTLHYLRILYCGSDFYAPNKTAYRNNKLYVGNVGDSRCIACHSGIAEALSTDHKPSDVEEKNRIEKVC